MQKDPLTPLSIVLGCSIIAAALYFALRPVPAADPGFDLAEHATPTAQTAAAPLPPRPAAAPLPAAQPGDAILGVTGPSASPDLQATVEKAALAALVAEKANVFVPKCWRPALEKAPQPAEAKFSLDMTFDPQGVEITRGIADDRSAPRNDVANCLRQLPMSLRIAPPGSPVRVILPLAFP